MLFMFYISVAVVFLLGSVFGFLSFSRLGALESKIRSLEKRLNGIATSAGATSSVKPTLSAAQDDSQVDRGENSPQPNLVPENVNKPAIDPSPIIENNDGVKANTQPQEDKPTVTFLDSLFASLSSHWMVWLGGICVGLSGIFLVKYSIDKGLLGPSARIALAVIMGVGLHGAAEYLRRKDGQSHPSFAALAGGASLILYAAMLAALHLYQMMPAGLVFVLLAAIAIATMLLALVHGPILAILGLLGGYVVPIFVSDGSGNILAAMLYSLIISAAGLLLIRFIYRSWLWFSVIVGALFWWAISLTYLQADGYRGLYLAVLAYSLLAIPMFNWRLRNTSSDNDPGCELMFRFAKRSWQPVQLSLLLILVAQAVSIAHESFSSGAFLNWMPLIVVMFLAAHSRPTLLAIPWLSLVLQCLAWLYCGIDFYNGRWQYIGLAVDVQSHFLQYSMLMAALYSGLAFWNLQRGVYSHWLASLLFLAPPLWMALAYLLVSDLSTLWQWSAIALVLGSAYVFFANNRLRENSLDDYSIWLVLAGHFTYSIAMVMLFREATLTLALALQLITLTWLIKRFALQSLDWLVKIVLALVLLRLTFNPWMLQYPSDVHWSLWTYGGATVCCFIAAYLTPKTENLRQWLEAVGLQLLVLFVAAEVRYWLYEGQIFTRHYGLVEAAINTTLWAALGLVYYYRSQFSSQLVRLYQLASRLLLIAAMLSYFIAITVLNPLWGVELVAATPIWNLLLAAYGLPVLMAYLCVKYYQPSYRKPALIVCGVLGFIFINMEIRHLWQAGMDINHNMRSGELYTYSIVWLAMAVATILLSAARKLDQVYRVGMGLLVIVIVKVFFVDMSDLQGLLRAVSFMGLGLALLGLAYLHQRISNQVVEEQIK